jgi:uncharacterized protein YigE (DUF2233 family)
LLRHAAFTRFALAAALFAVLAGCSGRVETNAPSPACMLKTFEGSPITVCTAKPALSEVSLALEDAQGEPLRGFIALQEHLGENAKRVRFAVNAGMYDDEGRPIGLFVSNGKEEKALNTRPGPGNFHLMPNGVFSIGEDNRARVETSTAYKGRGGQSKIASQSGPMLVIDGKLHPDIQEDGPSRNIRNGIGVNADGDIVVAISETPVSFGRFARFFRDEVACPNALFFDGTVSSLWDPATQRIDTSYPLGPILVVSTPKAQDDGR